MRRELEHVNEHLCADMPEKMFVTEHYRQIFELTRLDEAVSIHETEVDALAAATV
jgi:hypothetical protein